MPNLKCGLAPNGAMPSDVRKVFDLPRASIDYRAAPRKSGDMEKGPKPQNQIKSIEGKVGEGVSKLKYRTESGSDRM